MQEHQRRVDAIDIGSCPNCNSTDYSRDLTDIIDDSIFFDCQCNESKCGITFKETFRLIEQEWETKDL